MCNTCAPSWTAKCPAAAISSGVLGIAGCSSGVRAPLSAASSTADELCGIGKHLEDGVDFSSRVVKVRRYTKVVATQCDIDASFGKAVEDLVVASSITMGQQDECRPCIWLTWAQQTVAIGKSVDELLNQSLIVCRDRLEAE